MNLPRSALPLLFSAVGLLPLGCSSTTEPAEASSLTADEAPVSLRDAADLAEARLGVPADLLLALAWVETRWQGTPEHAEEFDLTHGHAPATLGVGGIRPWLEGDPLAVAQETLETDAGTIDLDPAVGLLATAVVLRELALRRGEVPAADDPGAFEDVLADYSGLRNEEMRAEYAERVLRVMRLGLEAEAITGERVTIHAREVISPERIAGAREYHHSEYDGAHWVPAGSGHWVAGRSGSSITHIIIHTMQGSYAGSISWFQSPSNPYNTSTHYLIRSSDGDITQMVHEADTAHHIGGWNPWTIGIEHEGYIDDPGRWYTDVMYRSSARLVRHLCDKYGVPIDRDHILGHVEVPGASHTDPGRGWDWTYFMSLVESAGAPAGPRFAASLAGVAEAPTELVAGEEGVVRIDFLNEGSATWSLETTRLGTSGPQDRASAFYADYNWIGENRATPPDAAYGPGTTGRFSFVVVAPEVTEETEYVETFQLVEEGVEWFGPEVQIPIRVLPRVTPTDPATPTTPTDPTSPDPTEPDGALDERPTGGMVEGGCAAAGSSSGEAPVALAALALLFLRRRRR